MEQLSFLEFGEAANEIRRAKEFENPEDDPAYGYAFLFICSEGNRKGIKHIMYCMTIKDAQALCSDKRTEGQRYGCKWMMMYISVITFRKEVEEIVCMKDHFARADGGNQDRIIAELGLKKIPITKQVLENFGFVVKA